MAQGNPEFLSNDFSKPHHRKAIATLVAAVIVLGLFAWFYSAYRIEPQSVDENTLVPVTYNPSSRLTDAQIQLRQTVASQPNPRSGLSPQEIKRRQSLVTSN